MPNVPLTKPAPIHIVSYMERDAGPATHIPIGELIRQARTARGLERQRLADAVGISYSSLASIERGNRNPSAPLVRRITAYLAHRELTGDMLASAIDRRYLGAQETADLLGISHSHLSNLRSGLRGITPDLVDRLIAALVLRPDDLLRPQGTETAAQDAA